MPDLGDLMKKAKLMQEKMNTADEELKSIELVGEAAGGMVKVTMNGKGEAKSLSIEPSFLVPSEVQVLEDLIIAAFNDGRRKADAAAQQHIGSASGVLSDMLPPGMKLPF